MKVIINVCRPRMVEVQDMGAPLPARQVVKRPAAAIGPQRGDGPADEYECTAAGRECPLMRMLPLAGESYLVRRAEAADTYAQRRREMPLQEMQHVLEVHTAPGALLFKVTLIQQGSARGIPETVESHERSVYLVEAIWQEGRAEFPCKRCLHGLEKVAQVVGLRAVQRHHGNYRLAHDRSA